MLFRSTFDSVLEAGITDWDLTNVEYPRVLSDLSMMYFSAIFDGIGQIGLAYSSLLLSEISLSTPEMFGLVNNTILVPLNIDFADSATISSAEITVGGYQSGLDFIEVITDSSLTGDAGWTYSANEIGDSLLITWLAGDRKSVV